MIFGYSTNAFVKFSLLESIEKIAKLGFKGVEIMGDRPHLYPPDFGPDKIAELKAALDKHQLKITNINSFTLFAVATPTCRRLSNRTKSAVISACATPRRAWP